MSERLAPSERHAYAHQGRTIYEWDQTLSELNIYVQLPASVKAKQLDVHISSSHLRIGITHNPPYLDVRPNHHALCVYNALQHLGTSLCCFQLTPVHWHHALSVNSLGTNTWAEVLVLCCIFFALAPMSCAHCNICSLVAQHDLAGRVKASDSFWTVGESLRL